MEASFSMSYTINPDFRKEITKARNQGVKAASRLVLSIAKRLMTKKSTPSLPGQLPFSKSGSYKRSLQSKVKGSLGFVGPTRPGGSHAPLLKYGTVAMKARLVPAEEALRQSKERVVELFREKL